MKKKTLGTGKKLKGGVPIQRTLTKEPSQPSMAIRLRWHGRAEFAPFKPHQPCD